MLGVIPKCILDNVRLWTEPFPVSFANQVNSGVAAQPVGFAAGQRGAEVCETRMHVRDATNHLCIAHLLTITRLFTLFVQNRIDNLRTTSTEPLDGALIVSIENFIIEIEGNWCVCVCLVYFVCLACAALRPLTQTHPSYIYL